MKKILVVGGTGQVGSRVTKILANSGYIACPASRHALNEYKETENIKPIKLDLDDSLEEIASKIKGFDAIIDCLGASDALKGTVYGTIKLLRAAKANGIKRFIRLSGIGMYDPENKISQDYINEGIADDVIAFYVVDTWIEKLSDLDWTVVRGNNFSNAKGKGTVRLSIDDEKNYPNVISMDDLAQTLVDCLKVDSTIDKAFGVGDGPVPIMKALEEIK